MEDEKAKKKAKEQEGLGIDVNWFTNENESNLKISDEKSEKAEEIKIPVTKNRSFFSSSIINYEEDLSLNQTNNTLNNIRSNLNLNFESDFQYESTSFEFSTGYFYSNVKVKLEYCRIICSSLKEKHKIINNKEIILRPLLCLDFNLVTAKVYVNRPKKEFRIMVLGCKEAFKFRVKSDSVLDTFLIYLNYYVSISKGAKQNLLAVSLRKDFYKKYYMTEKQFSEKSKTGDILLFRGFEFPSKCQRFFTQAEYGN